MKKTQKRAFILNECKSPYIAQAIFILKDGVSEQESGVLADAERIVSSYMGQNKCFKERKPALFYLIFSACTSLLISGLVFSATYFI